MDTNKKFYVSGDNVSFYFIVAFSIFMIIAGCVLQILFFTGSIFWGLIFLPATILNLLVFLFLILQSFTTICFTDTHVYVKDIKGTVLICEIKEIEEIVFQTDSPLFAKERRGDRLHFELYGNIKVERKSFFVNDKYISIGRSKAVLKYLEERFPNIPIIDTKYI